MGYTLVVVNYRCGEEWVWRVVGVGVGVGVSV